MIKGVNNHGTTRRRISTSGIESLHHDRNEKVRSKILLAATEFFLR